MPSVRAPHPPQPPQPSDWASTSHLKPALPHTNPQPNTFYPITRHTLAILALHLKLLPQHLSAPLSLGAWTRCCAAWGGLWTLDWALYLMVPGVLQGIVSRYTGHYCRYTYCSGPVYLEGSKVYFESSFNLLRYQSLVTRPFPLTNWKECFCCIHLLGSLQPYVALVCLTICNWWLRSTPGTLSLWLALCRCCWATLAMCNYRLQYSAGQIQLAANALQLVVETILRQSLLSTVYPGAFGS